MLPEKNTLNGKELKRMHDKEQHPIQPWPCEGN